MVQLRGRATVADPKVKIGGDPPPTGEAAVRAAVADPKDGDDDIARPRKCSIKAGRCCMFDGGMLISF
jgi:hypothetical protein